MTALTIVLLAVGYVLFCWAISLIIQRDQRARNNARLRRALEDRCDR